MITVANGYTALALIRFADSETEFALCYHSSDDERIHTSYTD